MKPMNFIDHAIAYVTLGLLCGWYHFLFLVLYPTLLVGIFWWRSWICGIIFAFFMYLTKAPLKFHPDTKFMNSWIFKIWRDYFDVTCDKTMSGDLKSDTKYMFFEFPQ